MPASRTFTAINSKGFSLGRQSLRLGRVNGIYYTSSTDSPAWLQFFTTTVNTSGVATAPTTTVTIPVVEFQLTKNTEFMELYDCVMVGVPGPVYCAISSTPGVFTTAGSADAADIFVEAEEFEIEPSPLTTVSNTSANALTVWTNNSHNGQPSPSTFTPNNLYDVLVVDNNNGIGQQLWLQIFATSISEGGTNNPLKSFYLAGPGNLTTDRMYQNINATGGINIALQYGTLLNFGNSTIGPLQQSISPLSTTTVPASDNGTNYAGCYLALSSSPNNYSAPAGTCRIYARYCATGLAQ